MFGRVVSRANYEAFAFACASVDYLQYVDHFLFVFERPRHFVVVSSAEVDHDMAISEEKHDGARIVQLVHRIKVRYLLDVHHVEDCEVLDHLRALDEDLVHLHAVGLGVASKPYAHDAVFLTQN